MRANVEVPKRLSRDKADARIVAAEHIYSNKSDDSSSDEEEGSDTAKYEELEPILDVGTGVFFEGDVSGELCVAQQETVGEGVDSEEEDIDSEEENALDEGLDGETDQDSPFLCSSQHTSDESLFSQECSQSKLKGGK